MLFRLSKTTVKAFIKNVNYKSNNICELELIYPINNVDVNNVLTINNTGWLKGNVISIYINPINLKEPKYISNVIYIIYYLIIIFFSLLLLFIVVKWIVNKN